MRIWDYKLTILAAVLLLAIFDNQLVPNVQSIPRSEREPSFRDNFYDVTIAGGHAWIVGYYGTILRSRDEGLTWELQQSGTTEALFRVHFVDGDQGWVAGSYGTVLHTVDAGNSWQTQKMPVEEHLFGLHFINRRQGWVVGSRGTILATENGGQTWENRSIPEDVILNDVRFIDAANGWIVGEFGRIYASKDGGRSWVKQTSPVEVPLVSGESRNLFRLVVPDFSSAWAFGLDGMILSTDDHAHWRVSTAREGAAADGKRYHLFSASNVNGKLWAVGERGTVLVSSIHNHQWSPVGLKAPPLTLNGIAFVNDVGIIVGNRGAVLRSDNAGREWKQIRLASNAPADGVSSAP
jgi:photosystem II stability/assembly factor-like uncharacterized protein